MVWQNLDHPNVLRFLGILFDEVDVYLVSPMMEAGSLSRYIPTHPEADRVTLVRIF